MTVQATQTTRLAGDRDRTSVQENEMLTGQYQDRRATIRYLRDVEGLTFVVIGERYGISPQAAWQAYRRAAQRAQPRKSPRKPHKYQGC